MTNTLTPVLKQKFFDNNGAPLAFGLLGSFAAGTSTPLGTFNASGGANANPVVLNLRGEADVWIPPNISYKFTLTDSAGNAIPGFPIDNVVNSQLVTLYGGVDTGTTNAYVLTFVANFTAYQDGIVIYWVASTTNSGASTINVNGLGIVNITNQDGTSLTANQIVAGQVMQILYKGGAFLLMLSGLSASLSSGSFAPAWTGFGGAPPTGTMHWQVSGSQVQLKWIGTTGTSTGNFMTIGNLPNNIRPATLSLIGAQATVVVNNGAFAVGTFGFSALGVMQFNIGTAPPSGTGFTTSGAKGLDNGWSGTYSVL